LASLLLAQGRAVTVADRHGPRRAQASELGAQPVEQLKSHDLVFEAVGRPEAWRAAVEAAAPGGVVVLVGGCPMGTEAKLPADPIHYEELELRGSFHHSREEVQRSLEALGSGELRLESLRDNDFLERDGLARERAGHPATRTQPVGRGRAAVQRGHELSLAGGPGAARRRRPETGVADACPVAAGAHPRAAYTRRSSPPGSPRGGKAASSALAWPWR